MKAELMQYNEQFFGKLIHEWSNDHKNKYVITGLIDGENTPDKRIGKVAQVRLEAGIYGSDLVLLRHRNNDLTQHGNQSFWLIPDKFNEYLDEFFKDVYQDDSDKIAYTLGGKFKRKGFIVKSPIKKGKSTPMRDIKSKINDLIRS